MVVIKRDVLKLYKELLKYGQTLKYTDKAFYTKRISEEFRDNKDLVDTSKILFQYKARRFSNVDLFCKMQTFLLFCRPLINFARLHTTPKLCKYKIDHSLVPILNELELEEKFVKGSGPGGSAVNKNANCVMLKHKPTGIVIKCHMSRCLDENRKKARELLIIKLDNLQNGQESVSAQSKRINEKKHSVAEYKKKKLDKLKIEWREREGLH